MWIGTGLKEEAARKLFWCLYDHDMPPRKHAFVVNRKLTRLQTVVEAVVYFDNYICCIVVPITGNWKNRWIKSNLVKEYFL